jgi:hypothetical protein
MQKAQSFIEYTIVVALFSICLIVMGLYVRRAVQANLHIIENQAVVEALNHDSIADVP